MDDSDILDLTGSDHYYGYKEIYNWCTDTEIKSYIKKTKDLFLKTMPSFDDNTNSEWLVRNYLSVKYILASTILGSSAMYAEQSGLKVVIPYLNYYTILNCCRSFIFTLPCITWKGVTTIEMTHKNIINTTADKMKRISAKHEKKLKSRLLDAKKQRNLFSYRFPATGLSLIKNAVTVEEAISISRFLTDLAQLNSACLDGALIKKGKAQYGYADLEDIWQLVRYELEDDEPIDDDDYYRVGYFYKRYKKPASLIAYATDGLTEDFFGAWEPEEGLEGYSPDGHWDLLLDLM